ncbi:MAG: glycosyltransferase family 4 protein [Spirochaetes bacterium]|nr:glycosyltransferase family 4 protein [Spirochaetota bacterium]
MEKIKNILIITERYFPEPFSINDLSYELKDRGFTVTVLTQIPSYPGDKLYQGYINKFVIENINGINIIRLKTILGYSKSVFIKILSYINFMIKASFYVFKIANKIDLVFVYHTGPLTQAFPVFFIKKIFKKKSIIWSLDIWPDAVYSYGFKKKFTFSFLLDNFVKFIYKYFDYILVSSPGFIDRLKLYTKKEIIYIPQWFNSNIKIENHKISLDKSKIKFVYTGNIGKMQGLENVIKAFSSFKEENIIFYIVGDGNEKENLIKLKNKLNAFNIIFIEKIDEKEVISLIKDCDYSVLPLIEDDYIKLTIPAKFFTYLYAQKPIFVITDGAVGKIVDEYKIGYFCKNDENEIRKKIEFILNSKNNNINIENSLKLIENMFNREHIINKIEELINNI